MQSLKFILHYFLLNYKKNYFEISTFTQRKTLYPPLCRDTQKMHLLWPSYFSLIINVNFLTSFLKFTRDVKSQVSLSICTLLETSAWQESPPPLPTYHLQTTAFGGRLHDSGRRVRWLRATSSPLSSMLEKEWEPLKRPGSVSASICLHGSPWSPARTTWDYTHVQAVTVICIGSRADESEVEGEELRMRQRCYKWSWQHNGFSGVKWYVQVAAMLKWNNVFEHASLLSKIFVCVSAQSKFYKCNVRSYPSQFHNRCSLAALSSFQSPCSSQMIFQNT